MAANVHAYLEMVYEVHRAKNDSVSKITGVYLLSVLPPLFP